MKPADIVDAVHHADSVTADRARRPPKQQQPANRGPARQALGEALDRHGNLWSASRTVTGMCCKEVSRLHR